MVKFLPKNIAPRINSGIFITIIKIPSILVSKPKIDCRTEFKITAIPVTPPGAILFTLKKSATPKEYIRHPKVVTE